MLTERNLKISIMFFQAFEHLLEQAESLKKRGTETGLDVWLKIKFSLIMVISISFSCAVDFSL